MRVETLDHSAVMKRCTDYRESMIHAARGICMGLQSLDHIRPSAWMVGTAQEGCDVFISSEQLETNTLGLLNQFVQTLLPQGIVISAGVGLLPQELVTGITVDGRAIRGGTDVRYALVFDVLTAWGYGERCGYPAYEDGSFVDELAWITPNSWLKEYDAIYHIQKGH